MRYFYRTRNFLKNPVEYAQLQIRVCGMAPWLEENIGNGRTAYDYDARVRRWAIFLCVACRMHRDWWRWMADFIQARWEYTAEFLTYDELSEQLYSYYWAMTTPPPAPWRLVTCPSCGREKRTLTSTGKIRHHSISTDKHDPGYGITCPSSGIIYVRFEPGMPALTMSRS